MNLQKKKKKSLHCWGDNWLVKVMWLQCHKWDVGVTSEFRLQCKWKWDQRCTSCTRSSQVGFLSKTLFWPLLLGTVLNFGRTKIPAGNQITAQSLLSATPYKKKRESLENEETSRIKSFAIPPLRTRCLVFTSSPSSSSPSTRLSASPTPTFSLRKSFVKGPLSFQNWTLVQQRTRCPFPPSSSPAAGKLSRTPFTWKKT